MRRTVAFLLLLLPSLLRAHQQATAAIPLTPTPANAVPAATKTPQHRPKIGVALEGGIETPDRLSRAELTPRIVPR